LAPCRRARASELLLRYQRPSRIKARADDRPTFPPVRRPPVERPFSRDQLKRAAVNPVVRELQR
jgi:hypothetical protein